MNITLQTIARRATYTIGKLYVNGVYFCNTLEPPYKVINKQSDKLKGGTAIPEGNYRIVMSPSQKFKTKMPFLVGVPHFTGIMIHPGNTAADTLGCILVGKNTKVGQVTYSRQTFAALKTKIKTALAEGSPVIITIKRNIDNPKSVIRLLRADKPSFRHL
ncbi:MAG: hypothetical protein KBS99_02375 [Prevotellaceae bacterium]|nr:hypothetical protein [Candidatus Colivivens caballi]